jgi:hypothetical protein
LVLKISVAAAVVVGLLTVFLVVRTSDEAVANGTSVILTVWDEGNLSRQEARRGILDAASKEGLTLYRSVQSARDGRLFRSLSVITRGSDRSLPSPEKSYPDFSRSIDTKFRPNAPSASPGGMYLTGASMNAADRVAESLNAKGMDVSTRPFGLPGQILWTAATVPIFPMVSVTTPPRCHLRAGPAAAARRPRIGNSSSPHPASSAMGNIPHGLLVDVHEGARRRDGLNRRILWAGSTEPATSPPPEGPSPG